MASQHVLAFGRGWRLKSVVLLSCFMILFVLAPPIAAVAGVPSLAECPPFMWAWIIATAMVWSAVMIAVCLTLLYERRCATSPPPLRNARHLVSLDRRARKHKCATMATGTLLSALLVGFFFWWAQIVAQSAGEATAGAGAAASSSGPPQLLSMCVSLATAMQYLVLAAPVLCLVGWAALFQELLGVGRATRR